MSYSEIIKFAVDFVSTVVWPATIIFTLFYFKREISNIFGRVKTVKKGDIQLELFEVASGYIENSIQALAIENDPSKRQYLIDDIKKTASLIQSIHPISVGLLLNLSENSAGCHDYHGTSLDFKKSFAKELVDLAYIHWNVEEGDHGKIDRLRLRHKGYDFLVSIGCKQDQMRAQRIKLEP